MLSDIPAPCPTRNPKGPNMGRKIHQSLRILPAVVLVAGLASCGVLEEFKLSDISRQTEKAAQPQVELPTIIAVMPFANETKEKDAAERLRKSFYNVFSSAPYVDIELATIDEGIVGLEKRTGRHVADMKPQEICQTVGCDGLLFGKVTDYQRDFGGVYSRLRAEVEIWMVSVQTGKEVKRVKESVDFLEGNIPLSPLGAIMTALSSAANLREIQETRMVGELAAKLVAKIPLPEGTPAVRRPVIKELITNVGEGPFGRGKIVRVGLQGEPGSIALFDIGNFRRGLPMRETQPGVYLGEYAVLPGDDTRGMPIIAYLKRPSGPESQWIDTSGLVAINTSVPDKVSGLSAKEYRDRVEISWASLGDVPDLAAYRVLRSEQPLTGFQQIATTEFNAYADRTATPGALYYYQVVAMDNAGNASESSSTVSARLTVSDRLTTNEASILSGELKNDMDLSGIYLLKGQVTVPAGVSLMIGPETTIVAENEAGIVVQGRLTVDGNSGLVRLFSRRADRWVGIVLDGGQVTMKGAVLSGAQTGLTLKDTGGVVENVSITDNDVGINISGLSGVVVRNCWVADNGIGVQLVGTDARIVQSAIVRNGIGLSLRGFSGEVSENVIVDNEQNIFSDFPLKLDPNYIGQFRERYLPSHVPLRDATTARPDTSPIGHRPGT
jgi:hypothetical protein